MSNFEDLIKNLPPESQKLIKTVWEKVPSNEKTSLLSLFKELPLDSRLNILMGLVDKEFKYAFGKKSTVAIVGPANVGKSTLYNQMITIKSDRALVSAMPGTTRVNQLSETGLFSIVDTPGADAVGDVGEQERQYAMNAASEADFIIIVFDAIQGIKKTEQELFFQLKSLGKPFLVVLNKTDLVKRDLHGIITSAAKNLSLEPDQIIGIVAKDGKNLERIVLAIASAEPEIVAALGRAMPQYRWNLAWRVITGAGGAAGLIGLLPLPFLDFIPLVITQSVMVMGIARVYNYEITLERARELIATFGIGLLGRTIFSELSKMGGIPGWILAAAVASSTTVAMGYASAVWFERGEKITGEKLKVITGEVTSYLIKTLNPLSKKLPNKNLLQQRITQALEQSSLADHRPDPDNPDFTQGDDFYGE